MSTIYLRRLRNDGELSPVLEKFREFRTIRAAEIFISENQGLYARSGKLVLAVGCSDCDGTGVEDLGFPGSGKSNCDCAEGEEV